VVAALTGMDARKVFRAALIAFGAAATALGIWWTLQGTGLVPVGFMANHMPWAWRGLALTAMGIALAVIGVRSKA
jgi:hypothetical protein